MRQELQEKNGFDKYIDVKIRFVYAGYENIAAGENQKTSIIKSC